MATSTPNEIRQALIDALNEDPKGELRALLMGIPERVERTVQELTPYLSGRTERSIEATHRKTEYKRLSTRKTKIGEIFSEDDPERVNAIEFGRGAEDEHGATPEHAMFRRAAALWNAMEL